MRFWRRIAHRAAGRSYSVVNQIQWAFCELRRGKHPIIGFVCEIIPELMNCIPTQKEMTYLWQEIAKKRNHTELAVRVRPRATPSKTA